MLLSARDLESSAAIECDICIIGGGAAGITIARELAGGQPKVCLLESGGLEYDAETQNLYRGEVTGWSYPALDAGRVRYFGGSTNHWAGSCEPFDQIDFEERPWVPYSGWPLARETLDPFYERAQAYCQLGPYQYDPQFWSEITDREPLLLDPHRVVSRVVQSSPPTRFGEVYRGDLERAANVQVLLHANALHLETAAVPGPVTEVTAGVLSGGQFKVRAQYFVLAAGGIENARILLLSGPADGRGLVDGSGLVGCFFMDHPVVEGAILRPARPHPDLTFYRGRTFGVYGVHAHLQVAEEVLRRQRLKNVRAPLSPVSAYRLSEGIEAYHELSDALGEGELPPDLWEHIGSIMSDFDMVLEAISRRLFNRRLFDHAAEAEGFLLDAMVEPTPDPNNRVTLSEERDAFGLRRPILRWRIGERDRENLWRCYQIIGMELARIGAGRVRLLRNREEALWEDPRLLSYANHHIGTTRMSADSRRGVVDANGKVHGSPNLFVAGSSVFPTASHVPPTLTIVALAIRLGDHLRAQFEGRPRSRTPRL